MSSGYVEVREDLLHVVEILHCLHELEHLRDHGSLDLDRRLGYHAYARERVFEPFGVERHFYLMKVSGVGNNLIDLGIAIGTDVFGPGVYGGRKELFLFNRVHVEVENAFLVELPDYTARLA